MSKINPDNLKTEKDAMHNYCIRHIDKVNNYVHTGLNPYCVGSACMGWKWHGTNNDFQARDDTGILKPERVGYCGETESHIYIIDKEDEGDI